jgi:DNA-binding MarR family transcriptional regulator
VRILLDKTGKGQLEVLSALAEEPELQQKEIVGKTTLSKGAVSNNVRKLKEKNLVKEDEKLELNKKRIRELYREHLETFLIRESSEPDELNDLRTHFKRTIQNIISSDLATEKLLSVLGKARERQDLESLNSVFKETDRVLRETSETTEEKMIGIATDKSNTVIENSRIAEEARKILDEVKE